MLRTLSDAIKFYEDTMAARPERDAMVALEAAWRGERPRYLALAINYRVDPSDKSDSEALFTLPERNFGDDDEGRLAVQIINSLAVLDMHNGVSRCLGLEGSRSPADLVPSFGIPLDDSGGAAAYTLSLEEALKLPAPEPETAGLMPTFKKSAARLREMAPSFFKIGVPDMQGPFNLAHAMIGNDAFTAPYTDPEQYHEFMGRVTDFWIEARKLLVEWIGKDRLSINAAVPRIAECSVNMVSEEFYKAYILPYDLRITRQFGPVLIHPCSGEHVFKATFENLPVVATEAGMMIAPMAAPVVSVKRALEIVGTRPVVISVGQELPVDRDEAFKIIAEDIETTLVNPRVHLGGYTGLFWRKKDRPMIRELHLELDRLWETRRSSLGAFPK